jgi:hypothetical protein
MTDDLQAEVAEWLQQAPTRVKQYLSGSIHVCNFLHDERNRAFQIPGANDGSISDECTERFKEQYEICDAMIKVIRTWA